MKHLIFFLLFVFLLSWLAGCAPVPGADIAATTLPVYEFTTRLCQGTGLQVERLVTESVSCLHDYSLQTSQLRAIQGAKATVISGAGLEEFLHDALEGAEHVIDASQGIHLLESCGHNHGTDHGHDHEQDPHIWLSPVNAAAMAANISRELCRIFPQHAHIIQSNLIPLTDQLAQLQAYGEETLSGLSCRELVTFHDGFSYLAHSFGLTVLEAVEEESGSEASAGKLIELAGLIESHRLPAIFTEANGSVSAASILERECGIRAFALDMAMAGDSYFDAMYHNIDTLREALL